MNLLLKSSHNRGWHTWGQEVWVSVLSVLSCICIYKVSQINEPNQSFFQNAFSLLQQLVQVSGNRLVQSRFQLLDCCIHSLSQIIVSYSAILGLVLEGLLVLMTNWLVVLLHSRVNVLHFQVDSVDSLLEEQLVILVAQSYWLQNAEFLNEVSLSEFKQIQSLSNVPECFLKDRNILVCFVRLLNLLFKEVHVRVGSRLLLCSQLQILLSKLSLTIRLSHVRILPFPWCLS